MSTAKKLPSGSWRVRVYSHTDQTGKKIYRSFTCDDPSPKGKRKCEKMAADWALTKNQEIHYTRLTIGEAIENYIKLCEAVLSPSTIRGYRSMIPKYDQIRGIDIDKINSVSVQRWINELSVNYKPKYIKNLYGLLSASIKRFAPDIHISVKFPAIVEKEPYIPSNNDVETLIRYFKENDNVNMGRAVQLAAFGTLRRSEVLGLRYCDIDHDKNMVYIRQTMVQGSDGCVIKETAKNKKSRRPVIMPPFFFDDIPRSDSTDLLVTINPSYIDEQMADAIKECGIEHFTFHDLRHYAASVMHALGIPERYIMDQGGWKTNHTLNKIYRQSMPEYAKKYSDRMSEHFEKLNTV